MKTKGVNVSDLRNDVKSRIKLMKKMKGVFKLTKFLSDVNILKIFKSIVKYH